MTFFDKHKNKNVSKNNIWFNLKRILKQLVSSFKTLEIVRTANIVGRVEQARSAGCLG